MREFVSTIASKGRVTIPAEIRNHLGIKTHNKIAFVINEDGNVQLKVPRYPDIDSLVGVARSLSEPLSWKEMRRIAYEDRFSASYEAESSTS